MPAHRYTSEEAKANQAKSVEQRKRNREKGKLVALAHDVISKIGFDREKALSLLAYLALEPELTEDQQRQVRNLESYLKNAPEPDSSADRIAGRVSRAAELRKSRRPDGDDDQDEGATE